MIFHIWLNNKLSLIPRRWESFLHQYTITILSLYTHISIHSTTTRCRPTMCQIPRIQNLKGNTIVLDFKVSPGKQNRRTRAEMWVLQQNTWDGCGTGCRRIWRSFQEELNTDPCLHEYTGFLAVVGENPGKRMYHSCPPLGLGQEVSMESHRTTEEFNDGICISKATVMPNGQTDLVFLLALHPHQFIQSLQQLMSLRGNYPHFKDEEFRQRQADPSGVTEPPRHRARLKSTSIWLLQPRAHTGIFPCPHILPLFIWKLNLS